jgi:hypothetical protein
MEYILTNGYIPLYLNHQQTKLMTTVHYSIISEKMVWIWYYDEFGGKHIKELLADDAAAFVKRMEAAPDTKMVGTDFLRSGQ